MPEPSHRTATHPGCFVPTEDGFWAVPCGQRLTLSWRAIVCVVAYKHDCFAFDEIRLRVETEESAFTFTEEDEGWDWLIAALPTHLDGMVPYEEWFWPVVLPPFERCWTLVYLREAERRTETGQHPVLPC